MYKEIELNKDGYLQEVKEWTSEDIKDFLSDFASVTDEKSIEEKAYIEAQAYYAQGHTIEESHEFLAGYKKALLDILNNTK